MRIVCGMFLVLFAGSASAGCVGSGAVQSCFDDQGNSYTVSRFGNTTMVDGRNSRNGSSWNQTSTTMGNTTFHNGTSADGGRWNMTDQQLGGSRFINGTDSNGNSFSTICGRFGCN